MSGDTWVCPSGVTIANATTSKPVRIEAPSCRLAYPNSRTAQACSFARRIRACSYAPFFLRSAQRFFIAIESRLRPSGVRPPRLRFFVTDPLGRPTRFFLPPPDKAAPADPNRALIARPSLSRSFAKSDTNLSRSKVHSFGCCMQPAPFLNVSLEFTSYRIGVHAYSRERNTYTDCRIDPGGRNLKIPASPRIDINRPRTNR